MPGAFKHQRRVCAARDPAAALEMVQDRAQAPAGREIKAVDSHPEPPATFVSTLHLSDTGRSTTQAPSLSLGSRRSPTVKLSALEEETSVEH